MRKTQTTAKTQATVNTKSMAKSQTTTPTRRPSRAGKSAAPAATPVLARSPQPRGRRSEPSTIAGAANGAPVTATRRPSKQATIEALVRRPDGAAIAALMAATGWQSHSVRAALTGLRKQGVCLVREPGVAGGSVYRITQPQGQAAA